MEMTVRMPANYNLLAEEEMTYTTGGATAVQALCAWFLPFYGWYKGSVAIRNYRRQNPDTWLDTGLDAFTAHMDTSTTNLLYDIACAVSVIGMCTSVGRRLPHTGGRRPFLPPSQSQGTCAPCDSSPRGGAKLPASNPGDLAVRQSCGQVCLTTACPTPAGVSCLFLRERWHGALRRDGEG